MAPSTLCASTPLPAEAGGVDVAVFPVQGDRSARDPLHGEVAVLGGDVYAVGPVRVTEPVVAERSTTTPGGTVSV